MNFATSNRPTLAVAILFMVCVVAGAQESAPSFTSDYSSAHAYRDAQIIVEEPTPAETYGSMDIGNVTTYEESPTVDFASQFSRLDRDGNQRLDRDEVSRPTRAVFSRLDRRANNGIDLEEWITGMTQMSTRQGYRPPFAHSRSPAFKRPVWTQPSYSAVYSTARVDQVVLKTQNQNSMVSIVCPKAHGPLPLVLVSGTTPSKRVDAFAETWAANGYLVIIQHDKESPADLFVKQLHETVAAQPKLHSMLDLSKVAAVDFSGSAISLAAQKNPKFVSITIEQLTQKFDPHGLATLKRELYQPESDKADPMVVESNR